MRATSPSAELCPICSAQDGQCAHELLRYSNSAGEFEDSRLVPDMHRLIAATRLCLEHALMSGVAPRDRSLADLWEESGGDADGCDEETARELVEDDQWSLNASCLRWLQGLAGVHLTEQSVTDRNDTDVYWADQVEIVEGAVRERIAMLTVAASRLPDDEE